MSSKSIKLKWVQWILVVANFLTVKPQTKLAEKQAKKKEDASETGNLWEEEAKAAMHSAVVKAKESGLTMPPQTGPDSEQVRLIEYLTNRRRG